MKLISQLLLFWVACNLFFACTKTESDFSTSTPATENLTLKANTLHAVVESLVTFSVFSSMGNANVTSDSKLFINGSIITGNTFRFSTAGSYTVYAVKGNLTSNTLTITVVALPANAVFKHKTLVEEYSGTWCGNCPRIIYGVELVQKQTSQVVVVSTHLFNGDPFITSDGNNLAASQGISGVPFGLINRTLRWSGPQYEHVNQVINTIRPSSNVGLAINSSKGGSSLLIEIRLAFKESIGPTARLTVFVVEDKLYHSQSNYSSNLYGGLSSIPNFEYNNVLRRVVSAVNGDEINTAGSGLIKNYNLAFPTTVSNEQNAKIIAFVTNAAGEVLNVQVARLGETRDFEIL